MVHELKTLPQYFESVVKGDKPFEVRKNDRNYKNGDVLVLREWLGEFIGRKTEKIVTCILDNNEYLKDGYVVLGMK